MVFSRHPFTPKMQLLLGWASASSTESAEASILLVHTVACNARGSPQHPGVGQQHQALPAKVDLDFLAAFGEQRVIISFASPSWKEGGRARPLALSVLFYLSFVANT